MHYRSEALAIDPEAEGASIELRRALIALVALAAFNGILNLRR